jgi:anthranilate synthase component 1
MTGKTLLIPVFRKLTADLDTPVSIYLKLKGASTFLLESVTGGEQVARYSFIGIDPFLSLCETSLGGIVDRLSSMVLQYDVQPHPDLPPFIGGAVGYFSWDVVYEIEKIAARQKSSDFPLAHFLFPRSLVVFDHVKRELILITLREESEDRSIANDRLDAIEKQLTIPLQESAFLPVSCFAGDPFDFVSSETSADTFKEQVDLVKKHIYEGDVFQLVLSQKFSMKTSSSPFDIYRKLRAINPSPYMYFFDYGDYQIVGSSPELLVKLQNCVATVRPIAGTRPRIIGKEEALIADLKKDEKECAEHLMLVDLGRNDLGRVCDYNSIETTGLMNIEMYSHVLHMVSTVHGTLRKDKNAFDLFRATFPAGTLSGAPKVRAIEIIETMEPKSRGLYGGALGYIDFRGNMDLCIIIRTAVIKDGVATVQAGAGLVADSDPAKENDECCNKARGVLLAMM